MGPSRTVLPESTTVASKTLRRDLVPQEMNDFLTNA
jgi:hypothetical protein